MYDVRISDHTQGMSLACPGVDGVISAYTTPPGAGREPPQQPPSWAPWLLVLALASWVGVDVWRRGLLPADAVAAVTPVAVPAPRH
jgi:hypothetical protein